MRFDLDQARRDSAAQDIVGPCQALPHSMEMIMRLLTSVRTASLATTARSARCGAQARPMPTNAAAMKSLVDQPRPKCVGAAGATAAVAMLADMVMAVGMVIAAPIARPMASAAPRAITGGEIRRSGAAPDLADDEATALAADSRRIAFSVRGVQSIQRPRSGGGAALQSRAEKSPAGRGDSSCRGAPPTTKVNDISAHRSLTMASKLSG